VSTETWSDVEWVRVVALAQQHSVAPLLYARLKEHGITPPRATAENLRQIYVANARRNLRPFHEVETILVALQAASIPAIPIKGASLAETVYGNMALRTMGDVDLWVQREQIDAASQVMQSLGYEPWADTRRPQALQDAFGGEMRMRKAGTAVVELHWKLFRGEWIRHTTCIDQQTIWQRAAPLPGARAFGAAQLCPEDAIIHLSANQAVNGQMSDTCVRSLVDLDLARRRWTVDWPAVVERARAWRVSCATWLVLQMLVELFGDPERALPLAELAPPRWRQDVLRRFVSARRIAEGLHLSSSSKRFLYLLALVDRPVDALVLVWREVLPDHVWLVARYGLQDAPRWRVWLQRLWHPLRIVVDRATWP
jgi:hypothetical protein